MKRDVAYVYSIKLSGKVNRYKMLCGAEREERGKITAAT